MMVRETKPEDKSSIMEMVRASGQFDDAGLEFVEATLDQHFEDPDAALWLTADDGEPVGVAYCAPEAVTDGTWNLLMLWTRDDRHGQGHGSALVGAVEESLRQKKARLLIVETSGTAEFEAARGFYHQCGFTHEATIQDFFAAGDAKWIYTKPLS